MDLICAGVALVDCIIRGFDPRPASASGYRAASCTLNAGGEAVNEAMAAAKLGLKTGILCRLGRDAAGDMVAGELERLHVNTERIIRGGQTPVTPMFVREDGSRQSVTTPAHRQDFHPEKDPGLFTDARALMLGSLFRAPFDDPAAVLAVLRAARQAGQIVFADTKLPHSAFPGLSALAAALPLIDYLTPNEDEARYFSGREDPEEMADVFLDAGVRNVIVKLGAKGCLFKNREGTIRLPAYPAAAVDTTGAGDNFLAGFASEILRGEPTADALRFTNACGAVSTTAPGASAALRSRAQVLSWMREHNI